MNLKSLKSSNHNRRNNLKVLLSLAFSVAASSYTLAIAAPADQINADDDKLVQGEIVARLPQSAGNVTFTPDGHVIFSDHPFYSPDIRVMQQTTETTAKPFPNLKWNTPQENSDQYLDSVLGLRGDENGIIWMIDMGQRNHITPKIVGWNTKKDQLERIYYLPEPVTIKTSQPQDMVVDTKHHAFFIADEDINAGGDGSRAAIIIVDMQTGAARRVLEGAPSTIAEAIPIFINGHDVKVKDARGDENLLKVGVDGICADNEFNWLYYGPVNGHSLYRIKIADLLNTTLSKEDLNKCVEKYAEKPLNGGLSIDSAGNIYLTDLGSKAVGVIDPQTRKYKRFMTAKELQFPDGVSISPDGFMYVPDSQLNRSPLFNNGEALNKPPYLIFRFKPLATGQIGH